MDWLHFIGVLFRDGCTFWTGLSVRIGDFNAMELLLPFGLVIVESDWFSGNVLNLRLALGKYRGDNGELVLFVVLWVGIDDGVEVFDLAGVDSWLIGDSCVDVGVDVSFCGGDAFGESFGR